MNGSYSSALEEAVRSGNNLDAVERVKQVVINELRATDERVDIHKTDYFNHSFVPDLVLNWRNERENRYVFLRPEIASAHLIEDVDLAGEAKPIFYCLTDPESYLRDEEQGEIESASRSVNALVTSPTGLEELIDRRRNSAVVRLASSAVLQGARGLLDRPKAELVAEVLSSGMEAASRIEPSGAERAARTIDEVFDRPRSTRLNRLLQAVWIGSGGTSGSFPGKFDLVEGLDEGAISYLLQLNEIEDEEFWRRIGRKLSLEVLSKLDILRPSANFQRLVSANLDVLSAKACRVVPDGRWIGDAREVRSSGEEAGSWDLRAGNLVFRSGGFAAYVAGRKDELAASAVESPHNHFAEVFSRLSSREIRLTGLTLATEGRSVSYSSDFAINVESDEQLIAIVEALAPSVIVQSIVALLQDRSPITCDFVTSTVSGKTSAVYPVSALINFSMALLGGDASFTEWQAEEPPDLELRLRSDDSGMPPTLFDSGY